MESDYPCSGSNKTSAGPCVHVDLRVKMKTRMMMMMDGRMLWVHVKEVVL